MTDINLKDFDKNNWDEFVHLRALKDVINQENAINNEQNQQITQNTNDIATAKQLAEDANTNVQTAEATASSAMARANLALQKANTNSSQLDELDGEVLKKDDTQYYIGKNNVKSINGVSVDSSQSNGDTVDIKFFATNGDILDYISLDIKATNINVDLSMISNLSIELIQPIENDGYVIGELMFEDSVKTKLPLEAQFELTNSGFEVELSEDVVKQVQSLVSPFNLDIKINQVTNYNH